MFISIFGGYDITHVINFLYYTVHSYSTRLNSLCVFYTLAKARRQTTHNSFDKNHILSQIMRGPIYMCFIIALHQGSKRVYKYAIKIQKHAFSTLNLPSTHFLKMHPSMQLYKYFFGHLFIYFKLMTDTYFHNYNGIICILELLNIMSNFSILVKEMHAVTFNLAVKSKEKGPFEK